MSGPCPLRLGNCGAGNRIFAVVYNCTMSHTCSYTIEAGDDGRYRGRYEVFDAAGRQAAGGTDRADHSTRQEAWASVWALAGEVRGGLG